MDIFQKLHWLIDKPITTIKKYGTTPGTLVSATDVLDIELSMNGTERIVVLSDNGQPILLEPVRGNTVCDVMADIESGINKCIPTNVIYDIFVCGEIVKFVSPSRRAQLTDKYMNGELRAVDLYGDYKYFEGPRRQGNLLYIRLGS